MELAKIEGTDDYTLRYEKDYSGFYYCDEDGNLLTIWNQYQLFDYLHELKIDYRGLIASGLAVSVYELKNNPYK